MRPRLLGGLSLPGLWGDPGGGLLRITASHLGAAGGGFGKILAGFLPDFWPDFPGIFRGFHASALLAPGPLLRKPAEVKTRRALGQGSAAEMQHQKRGNTMNGDFGRNEWPKPG